MNLKTWLSAVRGRTQALADFMQMTKGAISQGAAYTTGLPPAWHQRVYSFTAGEVGYLDMLSEADLNELIRINPLITREIERRAYEAAMA